MKYHSLEHSGIRISELGLGTLTFGAEVDEQTSVGMFRRCLNAGINLIDTADVYSNGASEEIVGKLLVGIRHEIVLATKGYFPVAPDLQSQGLSRQRIVQALEASLMRMKTDYIDLYYAHYFDAATPIEEVLQTVDDLVRQGKIRHAGVSNWSAWQIAKALGISAHHNWTRFECVQPMYSLIKRQAEVEILPLAQSESLTVIPYGALAGGLLSGKYGTSLQPEDGRLLTNAMYSRRYGQAAYLEVAENLNRYAEKQALHPATLAVAWVKSHPAVTSVLIGGRNVEQLEPQLKAVDIQVTTEWRREISSLSVDPPPATDRSEESFNGQSTASDFKFGGVTAGKLSGLTDEQLRQFSENGFVGPLTLCSEAEMAEMRLMFERTVFSDELGLSMRHLDYRPLYDLCCRSKLLDAIATILGPDLVIWRCRFIIKEPGAREIPWHSDMCYHVQHLDPVVNVSAWIAIDDTDEDNACVRLIPGSHLQPVPHVESAVELDPDFALMADPSQVQGSKSVNMRLKAGQFFLFNASILHGSRPNSSPRRRAGLSIRVTVPSVKVKVGPQEIPLLVRGKDRYGYNLFAQAPDPVVRS